mmetsp:Transcript_5008/g.14733  ORF Transcript_5008/g.14733 Transcript_5008/m.14733 type:complete len:149 (-) Transcript_5008:396-842(-)
MCEDCDVELFMALPRVVMLSSFRRPQGHVALVRSLLPHAVARGVGEEEPALCTELRAVLDAYRALTLHREGAADPHQLLLRRAITGDDETEACPAQREAVASFMRDLEGWSVALHRQRPDDWNSCIWAVLLALGYGGGQRGADTERWV